MPATAIEYALTKWSEKIAKGVFTATMEWTLNVTISSDVADMAPSQIAGLFDWLPVEGSAYATYNALWPYASCRSVACDQVEGGVYLYTTEWSDENSKANGEDPQSQATDEDPLNDLPVIKPVGGMRERAITKDRNDEAILNKAGDPVIQSVEDNTINISVTANVAVDSGVEELVVALRNRVNEAPIQVGRWFIDTNMARVIFESNFLSEVKRRNGTEYLEFSYLLSIDERDLHKGTPLNAGFRQRVAIPDTDPVEYTQETILGLDGGEPSEPVPLTSTGAKMDDPTPDTVEYLSVEKYQEGDFTNLPGVIAWAGP
jgi:hypothetical protein